MREASQDRNAATGLDPIPSVNAVTVAADAAAAVVHAVSMQVHDERKPPADASFLPFACCCLTAAAFPYLSLSLFA